MTQERDAISTVFDAYTGDCDALRAEAARLRAALIYLADGVDDEVQPLTGSPLAEHVRHARAALRGEPATPRGALADGHLWPTDLTDGAALAARPRPEGDAG